MKQIHKFAVKWSSKFRDRGIDCRELIGRFMADDCEALGFEMDCGNSFYEKYGYTVNNHEELGKIIDDVTDIDLLGSAIYSEWRYFNNWAYSDEEILASENRAWFILALDRLAALSDVNESEFQGKLKKVRIISNNICFGPMPEPNEEVEQHITVNDKGEVRISRYNYGNGFGKFEKASSSELTIKKSAAARLLSSFARYFSRKYSDVLMTDVGTWKIELTNTENTMYTSEGALGFDLNCSLRHLSKLVRNTVGIDDLFVFDDKYKKQ